MDHPFQHNVIAFDGEQEQGNPPTKMSIDDIYTLIMARATWLECGANLLVLTQQKHLGSKD